MSKTIVCLSLCGLLGMPMMLSNAALAQSKPSATQQLNKANQSEPARGHVYDGRPAPANPVRGDTAPKPNPVGQNIQSTAGNPGYKPAAPSMRTTAPPAPARNLNPTGDKAVQKGIDGYTKPK